MTPEDIEAARGAIRTVRESATGTGILGPAALNLANAVEVLASDHGRVLTLLDDLREWIRSNDVWPPASRAALLERIDEELEEHA